MSDDLESARMIAAAAIALSEAPASLSPEPEPEPPKPGGKVTRTKKTKPNGAEAAARPSTHP